MSALEFWDNLLQLTVTLLGGLYCLYLARSTRNRCFVFLSGAQMGWALGLCYWVLYLSLRGRLPMEPNPAQFVWSGGHLFYIAIIRCLIPAGQGRPIPPLAFLAPLLTLPFTISWLAIGGDNNPLVSLAWGAGIAWIAFECAKALIHCLREGDRAQARYHALVLAMLLFDEMVLFSELFYTPADYQRMNWYYAFDLLVTLTHPLQILALRKAVRA